MRNKWLMDLDDTVVTSFLHLEAALTGIAKLGSAFALLFSSSSSTFNMEPAPSNFSSFHRITSTSTLHFKLLAQSGTLVFFGKLLSDSERLCSTSLLSLAAAIVPPPPPDNFSSKVLAVPPPETSDSIVQRRSCEVHHGRAFHDPTWRRHAIEPRTGIEFPLILDDFLAAKTDSDPNFCSEVLVGTGSRTMTIVKIKSLKIYAFGFYVHPYSICDKLGPKYASFSADELNKRPDFYEDLLRQDISMTVRLVVSCNGMKINTVRDAFEKSLRTRLVKANPNTDFHCIKSFGSCFTQDIPLPAGTTIDFRRTADGQLITEIGGNQIGAVQSKDLCRAFFSMYIGDVPVSEQTKEDIGINVANMMSRC